MRLSDTEKLQVEYVELFNKYMDLPDDGKEPETLKQKLRELEQTLTMRFLFESGYDFESGNFIKSGQ